MDDSPLNVERLMVSSASVGVFDSAGAFTVTQEKAVLKLARAQLPRSAAWISKVVQAAVASGAPKVEIKQTRTQTLLSFSPAKQFFATQVYRLLLQAEVAGRGAAWHLAVGLRALAAQSERPFKVAFRQGREKCEILEFRNGSLTCNTDQVQVKSALQIRLTVEYPSEEKGTGIFGLAPSSALAAREFAELATFAVCAPIPIRFGRYDVAHLGVPRKAWGADCQEIVLFLEGLVSKVETLEEGALRVPRNVLRQVRPGLKADIRVAGLVESFRLLEDQDFVGFARVSFTEDQFAPSKLQQPSVGLGSVSMCHWVQDGVIIHQEPLQVEQGACTLDLFVSAHELPTDLSTFGLLENRAKETRLRAALSEAMERVQHRLDPNNFRFSRSPGDALAMGLVLGGLLLSLPFGLPLGGAVFLGGASLLVGADRPSHQPDPKAMVAALQRLLRNLETLTQKLG